MPYQYQPPRGFAVAVALRGAYTPPRGFAVAVAFAPPGDLPVANDDVYATGKNMPLRVVAPGVLLNDIDPGGQGLTAHWLAGPAHGTLSLAADGGFSYTPAAGFLGADEWTYYARDGAGLESEPATVRIDVSVLPTPRYVQTGADLPWTRTAPRLRSVGSGFLRAERVRRSTGLPWTTAPALDRTARIAWRRGARVQHATGIRWSLAAPLHAPTIQIPLTHAARRRTSIGLPWGMPPVRQRAAALPWSAPPRQLVHVGLPWSIPPHLRSATELPFDHPPVRTRRWWLPWGHAGVVQWIVRGPGITPPPAPPPPPKYQPPRGFAVGVNLACPQLHFRGFAAPVPIGPAACYFAWPKPRTYIVLNTVTVIATATQHVIECSAIEISESRDDMHHAVSLTLADPADLAWLTPQPAGPIEIEININGHLRTAIVEDWTDTLAFPGASAAASGRALTALLDAPFAPPRAYVETAERLAAQLVDRELDLTGFAAGYATIDWTIPAGVWHYDALSPAAAIRTIAAASGSIARAHPWQRVVEILPRWPVSPWHWSTTAAAVIVRDDYVPRVVARNNVSAAPVYELQLPLWPTSAADKPGLLRPGQLVEFAALRGWKAQVTHVRISASMERASDAAALVVWQTVTLEAPPAAPRYDYVLVSGTQTGVSDPILREGTAGTHRLPQITDPLITTHAVAAERGRNALAGGADDTAAANVWLQLTGLLPQSRLIKGNVTATNADGSVTIATSDGATIRARPLPGQTWAVTDGVFVEDGRVVDTAPSLPGVTQYV